MSDLISRQAAIDAVKRLSLGETDATRLAMRIEDYLERLPSAQPRPKGKWIPYSKVYENRNRCFECDYHLVGTPTHEANFCPKCGAEMVRGEQDDSSQE